MWTCTGLKGERGTGVEGFTVTESEAEIIRKLSTNCCKRGLPVTRTTQRKRISALAPMCSRALTTSFEPSSQIRCILLFDVITEYMYDVHVITDEKRRFLGFIFGLFSILILILIGNGYVMSIIYIKFE